VYDQKSSHDQQNLRAELAKAQEKLDGLVHELRGVDAELEELAPEQQRYRLLTQACVSLEALDEIGAAELFWSGRASVGEAQTHLRTVRGRVDTFQKRLDEIEVRRQGIVDELEQTEESADWLESDIEDAERAAEERANEWVIERDLGELPITAAVMPWTRGGEDDRQFRKNLGIAMLLSLLLGIVFPMIDLPIPDAWLVEEIPERFTNLIEKKIELPPPPPVVEEAQPEELDPEPVDELIAEEPAPKSESQPEPKKTAESKGILAFREKFSSLADNDPAAKLGAMAKINDAGEAASGRPERSMVTTTAPGSSGGINLSRLSRDTGGSGGGQIEGVQVARATSSIGSGTGNGRPLSGGGAGMGRTDEEIQIVFDRHKSALYRLYNRELRKNPTLRGQMVLRMTIEPDGSVSLCQVQSTDMKAPELASQVVGRVKTFDFGAKEVPAVTILYPIDFLPAT
jgi:hypothetical protein